MNYEEELKKKLEGKNNGLRQISIQKTGGKS